MKVYKYNGRTLTLTVTLHVLAIVILLFSCAVVITGQVTDPTTTEDPTSTTDDPNASSSTEDVTTTSTTTEATTTTTTTTTAPTTTTPLPNTTTTAPPFHPYPEKRKMKKYGENCIPDLVEILAMHDVVTEAAGVQNVYLRQGSDWTEEWERKYIDYLTEPSPFSLQRVRTPETVLAWKYGVCNYTRLLHCYHTGTIMDLKNNSMDTLGTCRPDQFYAHDPDNPAWSQDTQSVNVGFPCKFGGPLSDEVYTCASPASCVDIPKEFIKADIGEKLEAMKRRSGDIYFIGLGMRIPMRNYLTRHATHVCKCPDGQVADTKGGCVEPTPSGYLSRKGHGPETASLYGKVLIVIMIMHIN